MLLLLLLPAGVSELQLFCLDLALVSSLCCFSSFLGPSGEIWRNQSWDFRGSGGETCGGGVGSMVTSQSLHQCTLSRRAGLDDQPGFMVHFHFALKYRRAANIMNYCSWQCDFPTPVTCDDGWSDWTTLNWSWFLHINCLFSVQAWTLNLYICEERPPFCMRKTCFVSVVLSCLSNDDDADIEQPTVWIPLNIYYFAIYVQIERLEKQHRSQQVLIQIYGLFVWLFFSKVFFIMSTWKSSLYAGYGC